MKRIVILGCENSHANAFLTCIKEKEEFSDVKVVGIYSDEPEASKKLAEEFGVPVLSHFADAKGEVDGVVITARHGDRHFEYAKPYLSSGVPFFIDKPFTVKCEEAVALAKELKGRGIRACGGSSLKLVDAVGVLRDAHRAETGGKTLSGYVRAPYDSDSVYGGFYFYAQHLVEMVCEIFGRFPLSVTAKKNGGQIHVLFHYEDFDCVGLFCDKCYVYFASRMSETTSESYPITVTDECFYKEFKEFYGLLCGEKQHTPYEELVSPVFVMNAIVRSLDSGREEKVEQIEL